MDLKLNIQYVSDRKGIKTAVLIPVKEWENLKDEYIKLKQYKALKQELKEAFLDIKEIERVPFDKSGVRYLYRKWLL